MKAIFINPEGVVCYIADFPEEPKHNGYYPPHPLAWNEYETALAAAKQFAVPFEDQKYASKVLHELYSVYAMGLDTIHPFPDHYEVAIKEVPEEDSGTDEMGRKVDFMKVAILRPTKAKQKSLLIEMMQEDEKNGMYQEDFIFTKDNLIAAHAAGLNNMPFDEWYERYIEIYHAVLTSKGITKEQIKL